MDNPKDERAISSPQGIETRVIIEAIHSRGRDGGKPKIPAGENGGKKWEPPRMGQLPPTGRSNETTCTRGHNGQFEGQAEQWSISR